MAHRSRRTRALALALAPMAAFIGDPAFADQFKQAADGAGIDCSVSARELTRFALVDDQFASVSKISSGTPYNDFAVTNEPLRGDIYVSVPETYAARWESETPLSTSAVRLVQAMANDRTIEGFEVRQSSALPARVGNLEIQLVADYRGASLAGKVIRVTNRGGKSLTLSASDLAPKDTLAVSIANPVLEPGTSTTAFVVGANGESSHD